MLKIVASVFVVILVGCTLAHWYSSNLSGYELPFGWTEPDQSSRQNVLENTRLCDRIFDKHGFPFAEKRLAAEDSCSNADNSLAFVLNNAIYVASYVAVIGTLVAITRRRYKK